MSAPIDYDLSGKVAFVAGIGSIAEGWGNGRAIAATLARRNARIFGVHADHAAIQASEDALAGEGSEWWTAVNPSMPTDANPTQPTLETPNQQLFQRPAKLSVRSQPCGCWQAAL